MSDEVMMTCGRKIVLSCQCNNEEALSLLLVLQRAPKYK